MSGANWPLLNARLPYDLDAAWKAALAARGLTPTEGAREAVRLWIEGADRAKAAQTRAEANPLRALREAAGLSQSQAAERLGISRGAWANAEKAATVTPAMLERARRAFGGGR